jgi:hypothetical protein
MSKLPTKTKLKSAGLLNLSPKNFSASFCEMLLMVLLLTISALG